MLKLKKHKNFSPLENLMRKKGDIENKKSFLRGFTLIETLVAISVLVLVTTGPLVLVNKSLTLIKTTKQRVIALYLAQDAVEYIKNRRDENFLKGDSWLSGMNACISNDGSRKCTVDTIGSRTPVFKICSGECENLKYDESKSLYNYDEGEDTKFKRTTSLKNAGGEKALILVEVSWGGRNSVKVKNTIFNWFDKGEN